MDGHPPDRRLVCIAIGHQLLQLQGASANEAESRADRAGAVDVALPQGPQGVGVVERDTPFLKVKAHAESRRQRVGEAWGDVVVGERVSIVPTVVVVVVVVTVLGQVYFTHAHGEEAEGWRRVQGVLCSTVMAAVWVVA